MEEKDDILIEEEADNPAETIKKLREKLKACETDKGEYLAGWQRAKADSVNARREEEERRKDIIKFSEKALVLELINLADSFDGLYANKEGCVNIHLSYAFAFFGIKHFSQTFYRLHSPAFHYIHQLGTQNFHPLPPIFLNFFPTFFVGIQSVKRIG